MRRSTLSLVRFITEILSKGVLMSSLLKRKSKKPEMDDGEGKPGLAVAYSMKKKGNKMAEGGSVDGTGSRIHNEKGVHKSNEPLPNDSGVSSAGENVRDGGRTSTILAKEKHNKRLAELKAMPSPKLMAEGGTVDCPSCGHNFDMGGEIADTQPNDFDVLDQDTIPMDSDTAENSGDEDGTPEIVKRAMKRRSSK